MQQYTGALTGTCTVTLPDVPKYGWAQNSTTGGHNVVLTTGAGTTVTIPPDGKLYWHRTDGATNVVLPSIGYQSVTVANGLTVTAGGLVVTAGGAAVTGASTVTGTLFVTSAAAAGAPAVQAFNNFNAANAVSMIVRNDRTDGVSISFSFGGGIVGSINQDGSTTHYNTTSDMDLKIHVADISSNDAASIVDNLSAHWFRWKAFQDRNAEPGFYAQEVYKIYPWACMEGRGVPGDANYLPWQMDMTKLIPILVSYIQDLGRRIAALEKK